MRYTKGVEFVISGKEEETPNSDEAYKHIEKDQNIQQLPVPVFRSPCSSDGAAIWQLVQEIGTLDLNSAYAYIMISHYFSDTAIIAEVDGELVGFIMAFLIQDQPQTLFIWQLGVKDAWRGKGLGKSLLRELLQRDKCAGINYLETTVSPDNRPSRSLFENITVELNTSYKYYELFPREIFPGNGHKAEYVYRIGPLNNIN